MQRLLKREGCEYGVLRGFKVEMLKLKHSSFWIFQLSIVVLAAFFLGTYFKTYIRQDEIGRLKLVFEILAVVFPVICSISVAYLIRQEEQISALYGMLAVPQRGKLLSQKLVFVWLIESIGFMIIVFVIGILGSGQSKMMLSLFGIYVGMVILSLFFIVFHFFLNLKFGMGLSLFWGIFESMQAIIYSNIKLSDGFRYIPFAWLMEWNRDVLENTLLSHRFFWYICSVLLMVFLAFFIKWFQSWEGRKNYDV